MGCGHSSNLIEDKSNQLTFETNIPGIEFKKINNKKIPFIIKIQSYYRGMKQREKFKIYYQNTKTLESNIKEKYKENLSWLLNTYPPLNDNIDLDIIYIKRYPNNYMDYYGEWDSSKKIRHGRGICFWNNGTIYIGYWLNDKANIKGIIRKNNGDIYEGEWIEDIPNGKGNYYNIDGTIYEGEWKNDLPDGN